MQTATRDRGGPCGLVARWWRILIAQDAAFCAPGCRGGETAAHNAREAGIPVCELRTLAGRWPDPANLLERRVAVSGLSVAWVAQSEPQVVRDLQRACGQCRDGAGWEDQDRKLMRRPGWENSQFIVPSRW